jgi:hypothetical protein
VLDTEKAIATIKEKTFELTIVLSFETKNKINNKMMFNIISVEGFMNFKSLAKL